MQLVIMISQVNIERSTLIKLMNSKQIW